MRRLRLTFIVTAALALAISIGAPIGSGAPSPCTGQDKTIINAGPGSVYASEDLNGDGIVCANKLDQIRDDHLGGKT